MATRMDLTPIKREFRTSTPAYAYDSGYFGSNVKSFHEYSFCHSSPFKFSPQKCLDIYSYDISTKPYPHLNLIDDEWSQTNVKRQLDFEDSVFEKEASVYEYGSLPRRVSKAYAKSGFISPSKYFAQLSRPRVDFLKLLKKRNCERIISDVLSYLPPDDLCRVPCVSKDWKDMVLRDQRANKRRLEYLESLKEERENRSRLPLEAQKRYANLSVLPRLILQEITNNKADFELSPKKDLDTRFNSFIKEGKTYRSGMLMKCPRCSFASKELHGNKYRCTGCDFVFCKKCFSPFRSCQCCPMLDIVPNLIIGSKRCKRNLKRL